MMRVLMLVFACKMASIGKGVGRRRESRAEEEGIRNGR